MHPSLETALAPAEAGRVVKRLARFSPGVAQTQQQIADYAHHWRTLAIDGLASNRRPLVALGDSLTQGIGASSPEHGYVHALASALDDLPIINLSRSGATTTDVLAVQLPALAALPLSPALVVCTIGNNDLLQLAAIRRAHANMRALVEELPTTTVIATMPAGASLMGKSLNRTIRKAAERRGLAVADVDRHLRPSRRLVAADRFHPNDDGYEVWRQQFVAEAVPDRR